MQHVQASAGLAATSDTASAPPLHWFGGSSRWTPVTCKRATGFSLLEPTTQQFRSPGNWGTLLPQRETGWDHTLLDLRLRSVRQLAAWCHVDWPS